MARTKRSAKLDTWNARKKLKTALMHQERINSGQYIAYRRPSQGGAGTWIARMVREDGKIIQSRIGSADDIQDADGEDILSYPQALAKALAWFRRMGWQATMEADGETIPKGSVTVAKVMEEYLKDCQRRGIKALHTVISRANCWIIPMLGHIEVSKLTRTRIEKWLEEIANTPKKLAPKRGQAHKYAPPPATEDEKRARRNTANKQLAHLKAALKTAVARKLIDPVDRPWELVSRYLGVSKSRVRFLSPKEQVKLVKHCTGDFKSFVRGALLTGCRFGELVRLTVKDYDRKAGTIYIAESKSGKPRHIYLTDEGKELFTELTKKRDSENLVFTHTRTKRFKDREVGAVEAWRNQDHMDLLRVACKAAGIEPITFHELRHTYASTLVNRGCILSVVASQLGHSTIDMVEKVYGHLAPNTVRDEVVRAMPRLGI